MSERGFMTAPCPASRPVVNRNLHLVVDFVAPRASPDEKPKAHEEARAKGHVPQKVT